MIYTTHIICPIYVYLKKKKKVYILRETSNRQTVPSSKRFENFCTLLSTGQCSYLVLLLTSHSEDAVPRITFSTGRWEKGVGCRPTFLWFRNPLPFRGTTLSGLVECHAPSVEEWSLCTSPGYTRSVGRGNNLDWKTQ